MKNFKTFAVALAIMISSNSFASKDKPRTTDKNSNSYELSVLLEDHLLSLERDYIGKVVFSVNEEKQIVVHSIISKEEFVRDYISEKLTDKVLTGAHWEVGKIYHLPVKMKMEK
ncbi:MAG TPA: hypothetical protein VLN46_06060 [Gillisia sp.]|nr:hypothetical protein [Gillisia sp.]